MTEHEMAVADGLPSLKTIAAGVFVGWILCFVATVAIIFGSSPDIGWPTVLGCAGFAAFWAGPFFGGSAALAISLLRRPVQS